MVPLFIFIFFKVSPSFEKILSQGTGEARSDQAKVIPNRGKLFVAGSILYIHLTNHFQSDTTQRVKTTKPIPESVTWYGV